MKRVFFGFHEKNPKNKKRHDRKSEKKNVLFFLFQTLFLAKSSVEKLKKIPEVIWTFLSRVMAIQTFKNAKKSTLLNMNIFSQLILKIIFDRSKDSSWTALQAWIGYGIKKFVCSTLLAYKKFQNHEFSKKNSKMVPYQLEYF